MTDEEIAELLTGLEVNPTPETIEALKNTVTTLGLDHTTVAIMMGEFAHGRWNPTAKS